MLEARWFDCGTGTICVLVMDPATSDHTWEDVATALNAGEGIPAYVHHEMFGKEPPEDKTEAQHIEDCKTEAIRLAELKAPATPATVTLSP